MIKCQICQHENPEGAEYCENCGASLAAAQGPAAASAPAPAPTGTTVAQAASPPSTPPDAPPSDNTAATGEAPPSWATGPAAASSAAPPAPVEATGGDVASPIGGADLSASLPDAPPPTPGATAPGSLTAPAGTGANARLVPHRYGAPSGDQIPLLGDSLVIGRFDQETGPVDIDLENTPEAAQISRHHAQVYREADGTWHVKDLGSTNGVFIKPAGAATFGPRITAPEAVNSGDEIAFGNARFVFRTD